MSIFPKTVSLPPVCVYNSVTTDEERQAMLFVHEKNLQSKIRTNYKGVGTEIQDFFSNVYTPVHQQLLGMEINEETIPTVTQIFNGYYGRLKTFSANHGIMSQSKFESTFLEEMSCYLFKDLPELRDGTLGVFNKRIFAGLKINADGSVEFLHKDVDFCIGKEVTFTIETQRKVSIVLPVVAVEVKTFLDATMFGEVKSSSGAIKNASPNAKTYVLMGYRSLADEHIIAARNDSALTEMFALRENANDPMHADILLQYWQEIKNAVHSATDVNAVNKVGKLLRI